MKNILCVNKMKAFSDEIHRHSLDKEIFVKINLDEKYANGVGDVLFSITNEYMLKADLNFQEYAANHDFKDIYTLIEDINGYHPYFFEFETGLLSDKESNLLKKYNDKWFSGTLSISKNSNDLVKSRINIIEDMPLIEGTLFVGASPIIKYRASLKLNKKEVPNNIIKSIDKITGNAGKYYSNNDIANNFIKQTQCISNISGCVYNVGQANCISINFDKIECFFDVGYKGVKADFINNYVQDVLGNSRTKYIILSHWDMDHILGVCHVGERHSNYSVYINCDWIAPDLLNMLPDNKISNGAKRLYQYLVYIQRIFLCNSKDIVLGKDTDTVSIWQGETSINLTNIRNNIGLIMKIEIGENNLKESILFCGDCDFDATPAELKTKYYNFIVSPHHGSETANPDFYAKDNASAVISVGDNTYGHPAPSHIDILTRNGFNILFTEGIRGIVFHKKDGEQLDFKRLSNEVLCFKIHNESKNINIY